MLYTILRIYLKRNLWKLLTRNWCFYKNYISIVVVSISFYCGINFDNILRVWYQIRYIFFCLIVNQHWCPIVCKDFGRATKMLINLSKYLSTYYFETDITIYRINFLFPYPLYYYIINLFKIIILLYHLYLVFNFITQWQICLTFINVPRYYYRWIMI